LETLHKGQVPSTFTPDEKSFKPFMVMTVHGTTSIQFLQDQRNGHCRTSNTWHNPVGGFNPLKKY